MKSSAIFCKDFKKRMKPSWFLQNMFECEHCSLSSHVLCNCAGGRGFTGQSSDLSDGIHKLRQWHNRKSKFHFFKSTNTNTKINTIVHTNLMDSLVTVLRVMLPDTSSHPFHVRPLLLVLQQKHLLNLEFAKQTFIQFGSISYLSI